MDITKPAEKYIEEFKKIRENVSEGQKMLDVLENFSSSTYLLTDRGPAGSQKFSVKRSEMFIELVRIEVQRQKRIRDNMQAIIEGFVGQNAV